MLLSVIIGGITCLFMIAGVLFFPVIKIKNLKIDSYWVIASVGALILIISGGIDLRFLGAELVKNSSVNPLKILTLFISMTLISLFLDEVGFFRFLACKTLKLANNSQLKLFVGLYLTVSFLTVFTSNDIIILTFTPFICYFSKNAKINPIPYLVTEFVAANTMSMTLIIGNPTNIYIATAHGVNFLEYFKVMLLPTVASAVVSFIVLYLVFGRELKKPAAGTEHTENITDKTLFAIGISILAVCTVLLAIGSYIGLEMWIVSLVAALSLFVSAFTVCAVKRKKPSECGRCLARAPWQLIPFVLSMFTIVLALKSCGLTEKISEFLGGDLTVFKYGALSFLSANVINNIPMSVLFCSIIEQLSGAARTGAVYAAIVGSNLGAILTPIGALAGIMWSALLKKHEVKFSYLQFIKYGIIVSVPSLVASLAVLSLLV